MNVTPTLWKTGLRTKPMSPMSWYRGSQLTPESAPLSACSPSRMMAQAFARRLPCVTSTPLGVAVLPEVNCRNAMSSAPGSTGSRAARAGASARRSSAVTTPRSDGTRDAVLSSAVSSLAVMAR
jgi:hypothetical protein